MRSDNISTSANGCAPTTLRLIVVHKLVFVKHIDLLTKGRTLWPQNSEERPLDFVNLHLDASLRLKCIRCERSRNDVSF